MFNLTQVDLAEKSGVGLRFVRELEQGKETLRIDKINQVLALFGHEVGAVPQQRCRCAKNRMRIRCSFRSSTDWCRRDGC